MQGEEVSQVIEREELAHRDDQGVVGHLPGGIDHRACAIGHDQELY